MDDNYPSHLEPTEEFYQGYQEGRASVAALLDKLLAAFNDDCRKVMFEHDECKRLRELLVHYELTVPAHREGGPE
tara:strand:- start:359 stop:583 length:225 start_codon:yes stop_codon:yes gene_type:complete